MGSAATHPASLGMWPFLLFLRSFQCFSYPVQQFPSLKILPYNGIEKCVPSVSGRKSAPVMMFDLLTIYGRNSKLDSSQATPFKRNRNTARRRRFVRREGPTSSFILL